MSVKNGGSKILHHLCTQAGDKISTHPVKLSVVSDKENRIVKDLKDFINLNLRALSEKDGIEVVLRNAVVDTDKKIEELKEQVEQALKRGEGERIAARNFKTGQKGDVYLRFFIFKCFYVFIYNYFNHKKSFFVKTSELKWRVGRC